MRELEGRVEGETGAVEWGEFGMESPRDAVRPCTAELARRGGRGTASKSDIGGDDSPTLFVPRWRARDVAAPGLGRDALRSGDDIGRVPCRSRWVVEEVEGRMGECGNGTDGVGEVFMFPLITLGALLGAPGPLKE